MKTVECAKISSEGVLVKILVTGYKGQLGYDVVKRLNTRSIECRGVDIDDFDLTDEAAVRVYLESYAPDRIIHCAAYTAVDRAEDDPETCYRVNVLGTSYIAKYCADHDVPMMYFSTDYVFDGVGDTPFETDSPKAPKNQYGRTKSEGEDEVTSRLSKYFIIRISWVFGINGANFIKTMLRLGNERSDINVVADQYGSPTYTFDLAILIADMIVTDKYGVYHATNEGICSWYEFACKIMEAAGLPAKVHPVTSSEYPTKAVRPTNSRLSKASLDSCGFNRLPAWNDAMTRYLSEIGS